MNHVIVIEFVSLDGVMQDPDGHEGFRHGGWAFRYGPEPVTGDPFALSEVLDTAPADLALVSAGTRGAAARLIYTRPGNSRGPEIVTARRAARPPGRRIKSRPQLCGISAGAA